MDLPWGVFMVTSPVDEVLIRWLSLERTLVLRLLARDLIELVKEAALDLTLCAWAVSVTISCLCL